MSILQDECRDINAAENTGIPSLMVRYLFIVVAGRNAPIGGWTTGSRPSTGQPGGLQATRYH